MIGIGRSTEVTRDEVKFTKFIQRLRNKFAQIFDHALKVQLVLKGICTQAEWEEFREAIYYDFKKDNNFVELRDAELLRERINLLTMTDPFIGKYYSQEWIKKHVLHMSDEDIKNMQKQMDAEEEQGIGPVLGVPGQEEQVDPDAYPPEDNTQEEGASESMTPMLDSEVEKYSSKLNKTTK
jgi:hypothetical protein